MLVHTEEVDLVLDLVVHTEELDLINIVFDVTVTLTEATNVVTERQCHACGKIGHLAKVCRSSHPSQTAKPTNPKGKGTTDKLRRQNWIDSNTEETEPFLDDAIFKVQGHSTRPITVTLELNGKSIVMEVDTGAAVSLMSVATQQKLFPDAQLQETTLKLHTYSAEPLSVIGTMEVQVRYANYVGTHTLFIVSGNGPTLFGRDWLMHIRLDWSSLCVAMF